MMRLVPAIGLCLTAGLTPPMTMTVQAEGIIVSAPTCDNYWMANSPSCSPEQRARAAEAKRKMDAEAATIARAEKAEKARIDALVAQEVGRLGAHRADDARKLVEMREKAAAATGRSPTSPTPPPKKCEMRTFTLKVGSGFVDTMPLARAGYERDAANQCMTRTGSAAFSGVPQCETSDQSVYAALPIGKRPKSSPVQLMSRCGGTVTCSQQKQVCESTGSGRATAQ